MYKDYLTNILKDSLDLVIQDIIKSSETNEEIEEKITKINNNIDNNMYEESIKHIANSIFKDIKSQIEEEYENIDKSDQEYINHIKNIWKKGFKLSTCLYDIVLEVLENHIKILESEHKKDLKGNENKVKVLRLLSDRSLQTFKSVLILGYVLI